MELCFSFLITCVKKNHLIITYIYPLICWKMFDEIFRYVRAFFYFRLPNTSKNDLNFCVDVVDIIPLTLVTISDTDRPTFP